MGDRSSGRRVAVVTNNIECERNSQLYTKLMDYLERNGWELADSLEGADKVVVCGCGFHNLMYEKISKAFERLKRIGYLPEDILVLGCMTKTHEDRLKREFKGVVVGIHDEEALDGILGATTTWKGVEDPNVYKVYPNDYLGDKGDTFYIKIAEGCMRECSYCVIKKAKGPVRSVPEEEIIRQFRIAVDGGYRRVFLMGEDTFAYGFDTKTDIIRLIEKLLRICPDVKFNLGCVHPRWIGKYSKGILDLCGRGAIGNLYVTIQHVNPRILERMGRPFDFGNVYDLLCGIKMDFPEVILSTDIIVGFPGETEEDFRELLDFFRKDECFDVVNINGYGDFPGTRAYDLEGKVTPMEIFFRWGRLKKVLGKRSPPNQLEVEGSEDIYGAFILGRGSFKKVGSRR